MRTKAERIVAQVERDLMAMRLKAESAPAWRDVASGAMGLDEACDVLKEKRRAAKARLRSLSDQGRRIAE